MKLEPFHLERWLLQPNRYDLASGGMTKLPLRDLVGSLDFDMLMGYGITNGSELVRSQIAALYPGADKDNVLLATGTAEANFLALFHLLEPGDELVAVYPTYMQNTNTARSLGVEVKGMFLREESDYQLDLDELKDLVTAKTRVISLVNPNNPTGSVISAEAMRSICAIADPVGAWVLCDGALRGTEVDGNLAPTPVEYYDRGIATGSLSKVGLTGLRIGWVVANRELIQHCWVAKDYTTLSHSGLGEYLATFALQPEKIASFFERARSVVRRHLGILSAWVAENQDVISWVPSKAGHTAFPRYHLDMRAVDLCSRLLETQQVLVSPGDFFGVPKHLRVRYSGPEGDLVAGLERFSSFLRRPAVSH
jgi:aspartate/methionine/tyrosine aminotransferase